MGVSRGRLRVGVGFIAMTFVIAIAFGASGILVPNGQRTAAGASTTITIISGGVSVRHGTGGSFATLEDGAVLGPGDTIKTASDARAVLTFFEGSTVEVEPDSELIIDEAAASPDGSTQLSMTQVLGQTWHVVTHLVTSGSKYEVKTTTSTASVRGTQFGVQVAPDQTTTVATSEGLVVTTGSGTTVEVAPGTQTTTRVGEAPAAPAPQPQPSRKVTVTVTEQNSLVVDSLGRANGFKDGKVVVQTPGAQVRIVDGKLEVSLPDIPDGTIAAHIATSGKPAGSHATVTTAVRDSSGGAPVVVIASVDTSSSTGKASTGVDISKSHGTTVASAHADLNTLKAAKVGGAPAGTARTTSTDGRGSAASSVKAYGGEQGATTSGRGSVVTSVGSDRGTASVQRNDQQPTGPQTNSQAAGSGPSPGPSSSKSTSGTGAGDPIAGRPSVVAFVAIKVPESGGFVPAVQLPQIPVTPGGASIKTGGSIGSPPTNSASAASSGGTSTVATPSSGGTSSSSSTMSTSGSTSSAATSSAPTGAALSGGASSSAATSTSGGGGTGSSSSSTSGGSSSGAAAAPGGTSSAGASNNVGGRGGSVSNKTSGGSSGSDSGPAQAPVAHSSARHTH